MYNQVYKDLIKQEENIINKCENVIKGNIEIKEREAYPQEPVIVPIEARSKIQYLKRKLGVK